MSEDSTKIPKVWADFNGLFENGKLLCLSHNETCRDESGVEIHLQAGMIVTAFDEDADEHGVRDDLLATGVVERSPDWLQCRGSKWCLRVDKNGIRSQSEL
jgi:hypothetical protein